MHRYFVEDWQETHVESMFFSYVVTENASIAMSSHIIFRMLSIERFFDINK